LQWDDSPFSASRDIHGRQGFRMGAVAVDGMDDHQGKYFRALAWPNFLFHFPTLYNFSHFDRPIVQWSIKKE
jgi:hypothetical protein